MSVWHEETQEIRDLKDEIARLRAALIVARNALRNDFEPGNQSRAYNHITAVLETPSPHIKLGPEPGFTGL
jgi:hypothetical protein